MTAKLFCKIGELQGLSASIGDEATLGRSRQATIPVVAELVSGEHARIRYQPDDGCYVLEDLGSTNGTDLDGMKVRQPERLGHLHVITLAGSYDLIFQDLSLCARRHDAAAKPAKPAAVTTPAPAWDTTQVDDEPMALPGILANPDDAVKEGTSIDAAPAGLPSVLAQKADEIGARQERERTQHGGEPVGLPSALARKADKLAQPTMKLPGPLPEEDAPAKARESSQVLVNAASLIFGLEVHGEDVLRFRLNQGENVVGRTGDCAVKLETMDVSRRHAVLEVDGGRVTLRDLGSSNHTFLEGVRLTEAAVVPLGSKIKFGSLEARLVLWDE